MPNNLKEILTNLSTEIDQETLLLYLQGQLPDDKKHEVEKILIDNEFEDDAIQGLQTINEQQQIGQMIEMLNRDLKKKTARKNARREKLKLTQNPTLYIAIIILLFLIVLSYFIISQMKNGG